MGGGARGGGTKDAVSPEPRPQLQLQLSPRPSSRRPASPRLAEGEARGPPAAAPHPRGPRRRRSPGRGGGRGGSAGLPAARSRSLPVRDVTPPIGAVPSRSTPRLSARGRVSAPPAGSSTPGGLSAAQGRRGPGTSGSAARAAGSSSPHRAGPARPAVTAFLWLWPGLSLVSGRHEGTATGPGWQWVWGIPRALAGSGDRRPLWGTAPPSPPRGASAGGLGIGRPARPAPLGPLLRKPRAPSGN